MNKLLMILALVFSVAFGFTACESGEGMSDDIEVSELPQSVVSYVTQNYPNATIEEAERDEENNQIYYEVELNSGEELRFDASGNFLSTEDS